MEKLAGMGCDMNAAWNRFLHDADFFEQCFRKLLEDPVFEALGSKRKSGIANDEKKEHGTHRNEGTCHN